MNRGGRINIFKGINLLILVYLLGWDFAFGNLAKQAIRIVAHAFASSFDEFIGFF
jgi:hypothetical protein